MCCGKRMSSAVARRRSVTGQAGKRNALLGGSPAYSTTNAPFGTTPADLSVHVDFELYRGRGGTESLSSNASSRCVSTNSLNSSAKTVESGSVEASDISTTHESGNLILRRASLLLGGLRATGATGGGATGMGVGASRRWVVGCMAALVEATGAASSLMPWFGRQIFRFKLTGSGDYARKGDSAGSS
jgi:hypothetical protein